ncbi:MAG: preprotein translocase subunit YajC [Lachnospiraceae bacterium]|nr:preprotein translocase subunit YajC [Lachnospiraceae bacterium]
MNVWLTTAAEQQPGGMSGYIMMIGWIVIIGAFLYFTMIRPQKKEQNRIKNMLAELEAGDSVLTSSGFYGVVIDVDEDTVIVEFGNNKNCRIPMQKAAITQIEKAGSES